MNKKDQTEAKENRMNKDMHIVCGNKLGRPQGWMDKFESKTPAPGSPESRIQNAEKRISANAVATETAVRDAIENVVLALAKAKEETNE